MRASETPSLMSPALKKYGLVRPDLSVKSPKRSTCFARIISMNSFWCGRMPAPSRHAYDCVAAGRSMRIITLNCNGVRSAAGKGLFDWLSGQSADVVCLQETKSQEHQLADPCFRPTGFHCAYFDAKR